ncbi:hypothetical protein [Xenorhabdus budapestensis]|uniref:Uncharacterized protein n=1 Tax=Xenorhabdus budapestensis TaxID=290110 RepID=A0A2D0IT46_XENBU|nr:hypothetical protein [Xenorhabdus budapestensis]PHM25043.1 hypothetical protein Xbud_03116 [Xenorhabdus budapestensis]
MTQYNAREITFEDVIETWVFMKCLIAGHSDTIISGNANSASSSYARVHDMIDSREGNS